MDGTPSMLCATIHNMFDPMDRTTGRGMLLLAVLLAGLSVFLAVRQTWRDAGLWLSAAIFLACYGAVQLDLLPRWRKLWLALGLLAGAAAFVIVLLNTLAV
jgi:hypothetical protein